MLEYHQGGILSYCRRLQENRKGNECFKSMFLSLVPKENRGDSTGKFLPITLYNVIFTIIAKTIANRLKPLLSSLISKEQSGYVEGRQILDGIIISHEIIHLLKTTKKFGMLIKLDLSKAFDKLNWNL